MTLHVLLLIHVAISVAAAFPPVIEDSCLLRPPRCNLVCTTGYQRGSAGCVCACATDPCQVASFLAAFWGWGPSEEHRMLAGEVVRRRRAVYHNGWRGQVSTEYRWELCILRFSCHLRTAFFSGLLSLFSLFISLIRSERNRHFQEPLVSFYANYFNL